MFTSTLRRTAVLATLAIASAGLAGASANGVGTTATSLAIRAVKTQVKPGGTDRIRGALIVRGAGSSAGRTVTLEAREVGQDQFTPIGVRLTGPMGGLTLKVQPSATTRYRWVFAGDDGLRPSHSGVVVVRVKQPQRRPVRLHTSLSVRAAKSHVGRAGWDSISGRLRSRGAPLRRKLVVLLSKKDGATTWSFAGAKRTKARGRVAYRVRPLTGTRYRLAFLGSPRFRQARSGVVHVAVRADSPAIETSLSVRGRNTRRGYVVSGQLRAKGHPLRQRKVSLETFGPDGWAVTATKRTNRRGVVSFLGSTGTGVSYRLLFAGTQAYAASTSGTVIH